MAISWLLLSLLPVAPTFQDGALSNLSPVILGWLAALMDEAPSFVVPWLVAHLLASLALALLLVRLRRRLGARQFRIATVASAVLLVCAGAWLVHTCWPDKIFFDASTIDYDVTDLVEPAPGARFPDADAVAAWVRDHAADRYPDSLGYVVWVADKPTIIVWGTWIEHYRLRRELASLRADA
ncbi:MAG TPA: hypothetical protein VFY71_17145 [Planctomycetota bacterium]|nr:hypothetical protein [Planctomycetota bacterium]